jgi:hypothetical protein
MAALTAPAVGNGTTVSGLGYTTLVKKVTGPTEIIEMFDTTDLATTEFETRKKVNLVKPGDVTVEVYWTGATYSVGTTGTFTISYPAAGSYAGTGVLTEVKLPDAENGSAMMATYKISFDGYTGPALTAA